MTRPKIYKDNAAKQAAYRKRKEWTENNWIPSYFPMSLAERGRQKRIREILRKGKNIVYLNNWFYGCEGHHINSDTVIHMPDYLHRSIPHSRVTGKNMVEINALAFSVLENGYYITSFGNFIVSK